VRQRGDPACARRDPPRIGVRLALGSGRPAAGHTTAHRDPGAHRARLAQRC
jgi:hypothetical protein